MVRNLRSVRSESQGGLPLSHISMSTFAMLRISLYRPVEHFWPETQTQTKPPISHCVSDSPNIYVWDPTRPIRVTAERRHPYDRSLPKADEILQRPMRHFCVVPDGCYRPWDLHPLSLVRDGRCVVTMLHESFAKRGVEERVWENGRWTYKAAYAHSVAGEQIEDES